MSGRAGRRGLDASGMVVLLLAEELQLEQFKSMLCGSALPLTSAFRLRYNTLLKLYAMETFEPERLVRSSFYAFQRQMQLPALQVEAALRLY